MPTFKTRFNYLFFFFVLLGFLFFIGAAIFYLSYGFPLIIRGEKNKVAAVIGLTFAGIGILYMIYYCGRLLQGYRNTLTLEHDRIFVRDAIFLTRKEIEFWYIECYHVNDYVYTSGLVCLEIWLKNGEKVKLLNYMIWNFKGLLIALKKLGIKQIY